METEEKVTVNLFDQNYKALIGYCINKGLTQQEAEDAVSAAFFQFWQKYDSVKGLDPDQQKKWIYSAVKNNSHVELRKRMIYSDDEPEEKINSLDSGTDEIKNVIEKLAYEQMIERLKKQLTEKEKETLQVMLEAESNDTFKKLTDKYDLKYATLRTEIKRFRVKFRTILQKLFKSL